MQIYLKTSFVYGFDWQKVFKTKCMCNNSLISQKFEKNNKNNMEYRNNVATKSKK